MRLNGLYKYLPLVWLVTVASCLLAAPAPFEARKPRSRPKELPEHCYIYWSVFGHWKTTFHRDGGYTAVQGTCVYTGLWRLEGNKLQIWEWLRDTNPNHAVIWWEITLEPCFLKGKTKNDQQVIIKPRDQPNSPRIE